MVIEPETSAATEEMTANELLRVRDLGVTFRTEHGEVRAIDQLSLSIDRGQVVGLVGESGSGKSVAGRSVIRLLPGTAELDPGSSIRLRTKQYGVVDTATLASSDRRLRSIRGGDVAMIFQEPMAAFAPTYTVGDPVVEALRLHRGLMKQEAAEEAVELMRVVGIADPGRRFRQYPFELSGGMRQRVMIAVALASRPSLLIADEPTTALDVTIQAQVLDLLLELRAEFGMAIVFITHDFGVIAQVADDVVVMYRGRAMERGRVKDLIERPAHPYTCGLLAAIPDLRRPKTRLEAIGGELPRAYERMTGCPFHARCPKALPGRCDIELVPEIEIEPGHVASCLLREEAVAVAEVGA